MTLPASGSISLSQVNTELGRSSTATISLGESAVRTLFGVASGAISMSNGYGKANQFAFTISSNQTNANLATLATAAGWNGTSKVVATIGSGVYISSNSTGTPALTISGSFPGGVSLTNNGYIVGMGGAGGAGAGLCGVAGYAGADGAAGGTALSVSSTITVTNNGTIAGGGGGGGGGANDIAYINDQDFYLGGGGGGGGRSSAAANSAGGSGGYSCSSGCSGGTGGAGTVSSAGASGARGADKGGLGGAGGSWGQSGSSGTHGTTSIQPSALRGPYSGGSGGNAVSGNSNITWVATGTRLGGIS